MGGEGERGMGGEGGGGKSEQSESITAVRVENFHFFNPSQSASIRVEKLRPQKRAP